AIQVGVLGKIDFFPVVGNVDDAAKKKPDDRPFSSNSIHSRVQTLIQFLDNITGTYVPDAHGKISKIFPTGQYCICGTASGPLVLVRQQDRLCF
ncbi:MAG: hypothetical protein ACKORJ_02285, partial [Bacteroidota bacterium]